MNQKNIRYYTAQIAIMLIAIGIGAWQAIDQKTQIKEDLLEFVKVMSLNVPPQMIESLRGDASDLGNPQYQILKTYLMRAAQIETEARFVYVFGIKPDQTLFFYADSEPVASPDYSPPGQVYSYVSPQDLLVFTKNEPQAFTSSDAWGRWVSVELPIIDQTTNRVIASLNVDVPQSRYYEQIAFAGMVPVLIGILFALALFIIRRLSAKDELILTQRAGYLAITAHDLKSPLTVIKWTAESLQESLRAANNDIKENLAVISGECREMFSFIDDLASASQGDAGKLISSATENVNIADITKKVVSNSGLLLNQKNLRVISALDDNLIVNGDANALRRAFANLVSNAIKYSGDGGQIDIKASNDKGKLVWSITDSGMGIPKDELQKVFTGYYRAKNAKSSGIAGTGLGLYYVKKVVEAYHGKISLNSEVGKGTSITLILPLPLRS